MEGGGRRRWIKKFLNVNIINCKKVDKPRGGGSEKVDKFFFVKFKHFLMFLGTFITYFLVFSLYLTIAKKKKKKKKG